MRFPFYLFSVCGSLFYFLTAKTKQKQKKADKLNRLEQNVVSLQPKSSAAFPHTVIRAHRSSQIHTEPNKSGLMGVDRSHLVQKALEHAGSFHRQRPWDANGLLENYCEGKRKRRAARGEKGKETIKGQS